MKITFNISCPKDALSLLKREKTIVDKYDMFAGVITVDSEDNDFNKIIDVTKNSSGLWFNPGMSFTSIEINNSKYFQLECRKTVHETDKDYELNYFNLSRLRFIHTTDKCKIRLINKLALSKINLKPNILAGVDEWTQEFIVPLAVSTIFKTEQLTGFSSLPVFNPKTEKPYDDFFQLYTENIMPSVAHDITIHSLENDMPEEGGFRALGCLTYDFSEDYPFSDFNRTAENFGGNFLPFWIVSNKVRQVFLKHKLKGWAFRPVIEKGSEFQKAYLDKWHKLLDKISINPRNNF